MPNFGFLAGLEVAEKFVNSGKTSQSQDLSLRGDEMASCAPDFN